jgi:hypothetical protein
MFYCIIYPIFRRKVFAKYRISKKAAENIVEEEGPEQSYRQPDQDRSQKSGRGYRIVMPKRLRMM